MKKLLLSAALLAAASVVNLSAIADDRDGDRRDRDKVTIAVFGDWPYSQILLDSAPLLVDSINKDRDVSLVIHVGDIHSGSQPCTSAGINKYNGKSPLTPPLADSNPDWNQAVYYQFQQIHPPVVYTIGDNEWTDCHKTNQKASGAPLNELAAVRKLFFAKPGRTLGVDDREVWSQAKYFDPAFPADKTFVENVMWQDADTIFVTIHVPGSNYGALAWTNGFELQPDHDNEVAARIAANSRWLNTAFNLAHRTHAKAVVIALQADMWDTTAALDKYTPLVNQIANLTIAFRRPVLLLNGDTHLFVADHPLADPSSPTGVVHHTPPVPNLTRITVQGSTNAPSEWLRLTIDTRTPGVFSWTNVAYCAQPLISCP